MTFVERLEYLNIRSTTPEDICVKQLHRKAAETGDPWLMVLRDWLEEEGRTVPEPGLSWCFRGKQCRPPPSDRGPLVQRWLDQIALEWLEWLEEKQKKTPYGYLLNGSLAYLSDCFQHRIQPQASYESDTDTGFPAQYIAYASRFAQKGTVPKHSVSYFAKYLDHLDALEAEATIESLKAEFLEKRRTA